MLYVYAIVDSDRFEVIRGEGHEAGDVVPVSSGTLAAAVSALSTCVIEVTPQSVWRHERVLERLMPDHAVLPLRFGTICPDVDTLKECLLQSADKLSNDLAHVRGKVEMALRIVEAGGRIDMPGGCQRARVPTRQPTQAVPPISNVANDHEPVGRGAAYLRARSQHHHDEMAREDAAKRLGQMLWQQLDTALKDVICVPPTADASAGYLVSCLVERDGTAAFADALRRFRGNHPQFDVTCTGPWPAYSFVAAEPLAGGQ